mmetsp:Transcript_11543/g.25647  ORF Transcript_11543/g.25647 Transcript_11543/m.25647 type:complete len:457 (-) Transcript_11543:45-1415(-)|eukprot:CAMPEP_0204271182 /NCGR_PEP_ID=MMETSP0468-20130131/19311_1 /ASSEMBLY_ACC=CAM_ASM_000383 /TAXON_ID=2969 /ORGANISM="Oxyrrhis marina" /LENGTH=456 /DNA_ID=CAMNT_0051246805 /DNA_START=111 /DNA_END=1481 /DNA_ORIENTATION=-
MDQASLSEMAVGFQSAVQGMIQEVSDELHFMELRWESLWHPEVAVCCVVLFISGILCSAAGIGGGGIIVAVLMYCGGLAPHDAVPVSKGVVFCGAVISLALNATKKQAGSDKALINWDIIKMMVPMALLGTLMGVLLNIALPGWAIVVMLVMILLVMTYMTCDKGWRQYQAELMDLSQQPLVETTQTNGGGGGGMGDDDSAPMASRYGAVERVEQKEMKDPLDAIDASVMAGCLVLTVLGGVLRFHVTTCVTATEKAVPGMIPVVCRHPVLEAFFGESFGAWVAKTEMATYLGALICTAPLVACCMLAAFYYNRLRCKGGWAHRTLLAYQSVSCLTGLLAGLIGIGGGLVFSPFFLLMQVDPAVAVATSSTCVIFTSSSTTFQYLLIDRINIVLAVAYGLINCVSSYLGTSLIHLLSERFAQRKSYITFIVALSVAISAVLAVLKFVAVVRGLEVE